MSEIDYPKKIEDVVIIVHNEELELFKLQLQTLDLFLEPCRLHIVINEHEIFPFEKSISKQIDNSVHNIRIWGRKQILKREIDEREVPGWTSQQLLKLMIPLKRDWISLDAKDLLIRPVYLEDLDRKQRKDYEDLSLKDPQGKFYQGVIALCNKNGLTKKIDPKTINNNHTPRVIVNKVVRKLFSMFKTRDEFIDWFCSFEVQGEYILHDYIALQMNLPQKLRFPRGFNVGIWYQHIYDNFDFEQITSNTTVYKCHRRVYNEIKNKAEIDSYIQNIMESYKQYRDAIYKRHK